jgi:eukaryotic-like serine/threonine-protein kinase
MPVASRVIIGITKGPAKGQQISFEEHDTLLLGRHRECHICLPNDEYLSRYHFIIEVNPPHAHLQDLGSRNGTFINGNKLGGREWHETPEEGKEHTYATVPLNHGDEIITGLTYLKVSIEILRDQDETLFCQQCGKQIEDDVQVLKSGYALCKGCQRFVTTDFKGLFWEIQSTMKDDQHSKMGSWLAEFEPLQKLAEGGMGAVNLVRNVKDGHLAVMKTMLPRAAIHPKDREMFLREIDIVRQLDHKNIASLVGHGSHKGIFFFVMEYCQGGSLADYFLQYKHLISEEDCLPWMLQSLEGLAYAHAKGFVHRDIKPQNILLSGEEGSRIAQIADFGLAKNYLAAGFSGMTITGSHGGTYAFMPREQIINYKYVTPASDIWSIGATFFWMLTGKPPRIVKDEDNPIESIFDEESLPVREFSPPISKRVGEILEKALSSDPKNRYQDAGEMLNAMQAVN